MRYKAILVFVIPFFIIGGCVKTKDNLRERQTTKFKEDQKEKQAMKFLENYKRTHIPLPKREPNIQKLGVTAKELIIEQIDSQKYSSQNIIKVIKSIDVKDEKTIQWFLSFFVDTNTRNAPWASINFIITLKLENEEYKLFLSKFDNARFWGDSNYFLRGDINKKEFTEWLDKNFNEFSGGNGSRPKE